MLRQHRFTPFSATIAFRRDSTIPFRLCLKGRARLLPSCPVDDKSRLSRSFALPVKATPKSTFHTVCRSRCRRRHRNQFCYRYRSEMGMGLARGHYEERQRRRNLLVIRLRYTIMILFQAHIHLESRGLFQEEGPAPHIEIDPS